MQRHSQEGDVKTEAEIGVMHLWAVEDQGVGFHEELGVWRGLGQILPSNLQKEPNLPSP